MSGLSAWGPYLMSLATAVMLGSHLLQQRNTNVWSVVKEQKELLAAHEATIAKSREDIAKLTVLAEDSRKDVFRMTVLVADYKRENERLGLLVLDQQKQIDELTEQVKQHERLAQGRRDSDDRRKN